MLHQTKRFHHISKGDLLLVMLIIEGFLLPGANTHAFADSPIVNGTIIAGSLGGTTEVSYNIIGTPGSTITYTMPFISNDLRGTEAGWNLYITSTTFTGSAGTIPAGASTIIGTTVICTVATTCSNPILTNTITGVVALPAALGTPPTAVEFFKTPASTGAGIYTVIPTITVVIPGGTLIGTYTSTIILTISSGQ
jgi:hypothetical protein